MAIKLLGIPETVSTKLNAESFDELVRKNSQKVRWLTSIPCPCASRTGADSNCNVCQGRGYYYWHENEMTVYNERVKVVGNRILEIKLPEITEIIQLRKKEKDGWYSLDAKIIGDDRIEIAEGEPFKKYSQYYLDYKFTPFRSFRAIGKLTAEKHIEIDEILVKLDTGGYIKPDIVKIDSIFGDYDVTMDRFYKNIVKINQKNVPIGEEFEITGKVVYPYDFVIQQVNVKNTHEGTFLLQGGDAVADVYSYVTIGVGDILTALMSENRLSVIMSRHPEKNYDELSSFDVSRILDVFEIRYDENQKGYSHFFKFGEDYILRGRNELHWIGDKPTGKYTVQYMANASYRVMPAQATMRYHQGERFPRKLLLKFIDKISEFEV